MEALPQACLARVAAALEAEDLVALGSASRAMRQGCAGPDCWGPQLQRDFALQVPMGPDPRALYRALRGAVKGPVRDVRFKALGTDGGVDREDLERYWVDHMFNSRNYDSYCSVRGADVHCFAALADQRAEGARDAEQDARREFLLRRLRLAASVFVPGGVSELRQWASADVEAFARELLQHAGADYGQALEPASGGAETLPEDMMVPHPMDSEPAEGSELLGVGMGAGAGAGEGELPAAAEFEALAAHAQGGLPVGMLLVADLPPVVKEKELQLVSQVLRGRSHSPPETEVLRSEVGMMARPKTRSEGAGPSRALLSPEEDSPKALRPMLWSRGDLSPGWGLPAEGLEVAVISGVEVSRKGNFTCPVSCGAVFLGMGLEEPHPLQGRGPGGGAAAAPRGTGISNCVRDTCRAGGGGPVNPFDGLETPEEVVAASSSGRLPPILRLQVLPTGVVIEFDPALPLAGGTGEAGRPEYSADFEARRLRKRVGSSVYAELHPVLWFSFDRVRPGSGPDSAPGSDVLRVDLGRRRVGNLACVKLISCENRMTEMGDVNEEPNIDINYVKFRGANTRLPPGLRAF